MKLRSLLFVFSPTILLCLGFLAKAAEDIPAAAFALADAMQVVETTRLTFEMRTQAGIANGTKTQKELECWRATDLTPARSAFAEAFARAMTRAQMEEATAFLVTPLGKKLVEYMNAVGLKARGLPSPAEPVLSDEEVEAFVKFLSTEAGSKLSSGELQTEDMQKRMIGSLLPMFQKCMEPKSSAQHFADLDVNMTPKERERAAASAADTTRPSESDAIKLVRTMRDDEYLLASLRERVKEGGRPIPKAQRDCIDSIQPTDISAVVAVAIQEQLSAAEVKDAISFYESPAGRKYAETQMSNIERPVELTDFIKAMTVDEVQSLRQFFVLSASRKLMQNNVIQQPASMNRISLRIRDLTDACLRERAGKR